MQETSCIENPAYSRGEFPSIKIEELADAIFPLSAKIRLMAMMTAYFDESGTHRGSPILAVAGYVAPVVQWKHFQKKWAAALKKEKVGYFHMTDFQNSREEFDGWAEERKKPFFDGLVQIILRHATFGVATVVVKKDYEAITKEDKEVVDPRTFCWVNCMKLIRGWADRNVVSEPIAYIIEEGGPHPGEILNAKKQLERSRELQKFYRYQRGTITFGDKKIVVQLQPADILVYEMWHQGKRILAGEKKTLRPSLQQLLIPRMPYLVHYYDEAKLNAYVELAKRIKGEQPAH